MRFQSLLDHLLSLLKLVGVKELLCLDLKSRDVSVDAGPDFVTSGSSASLRIVRVPP